MMIKKSALVGLAIGAAMSCVAPAEAAIFNVGSSNFFLTNGTPESPSITGIFFNSFSASTPFDDIFVFTIPQDGTGSGSISTSFSGPDNFLTITDLLINGMSYNVPANSGGQSIAVNAVDIFKDVTNYIQVKGFTSGSGVYSGTATFQAAAAVPETATWMMMVVGFGALGAALRKKPKVTFAAF
jgi:hypothetical protein